ncbi:hypothetical protein BHE74_00001508, partial [Ensete ventricosum]
DGELFIWGNNSSGQLGLGKSTKSIIYLPTRVDFFVGINIKMVALGSEHSIAITAEKGCVFIFGERSTNELEIGEGKNIRTPTVVREIPDSEEVACGGYHTCIVTSNVFNQLPNWLLVACGWKHTAVISVYYVNVKVATSLPGAGEVLVEHFLRIAILLEDNL